MKKNDILRMYEDGAYAYGNGEFREAAAIFSDLVRLNHAPAATYLGQMYIRGEGVAADIETGLNFLKLAASWGNSTAAFNLGALYRSGSQGVPINADESRAFFQLAKELGSDLSIEQYL